MTARRIAAGSILGVALAGCGVLPGLESQAPVPETQVDAPQPPSDIAPPLDVLRTPSAVDSLLAYFQRVRRLPAADLGREHEAARQAFQSSYSEFNRVRYAMLLSLPGTTFGDESRALEVLDPVARNPAGQLHGLALLIAANLQERRRLDANAQVLQRKLDALMSLERSMIERKR